MTNTIYRDSNLILHFYDLPSANTDKPMDKPIENSNGDIKNLTLRSSNDQPKKHALNSS